MPDSVIFCVKLFTTIVWQAKKSCHAENTCAAVIVELAQGNVYKMAGLACAAGLRFLPETVAFHSINHTSDLIRE